MNTEDELASYLAALERDACYRVDAVLKQGALETTERVYFRGENGAELGPFVRKRISGETGLGGAYEEVFAAERRGVRFAHLPRLLECHRRDGDLVVVMELVPGETLAACVGECKGPSARLELARRVFPELCDAVSELHERLDPPVIHRDLKPSNVMVSLGGVTLIDLGIARAWRADAEQDTVHFGTRTYAPPEQFGFGQTDVTSDVFALGMLLFFCATGREPQAADREGGFAGAGVSFIYSSKKNIAAIKKLMNIQSIGPDKLSQLAHYRYLKSVAGIYELMEKHAELLRPKFEAVAEVLEEELGGTGIATWTKPTGGYFISVDLYEGTAKRTVSG